MSDDKTPGQERFRQYRSIIPDFPLFRSNLTSRRPEALRTNRWVTDTESLRRDLRQRGHSVRPHATLPNLLVWSDDGPASGTLPHWVGRYYLQDPASLVPVLALQANRGDVVLDLCAAPGGKALHVSEFVQEAGVVVANEPDSGRRIVLETNHQRLGAPNLLIGGYNGASVPESESVDAVLVDAPCSGEGTVRTSDEQPRRAPVGRLRELAEVQVRLLRKAARLVRPGGTVVYSTCSFAPEENEAVLDQVLTETELELDTVPLDLPHEPGIQEWDGTRYRAAMGDVWRIYPRHLDGGGMTLARLKRPRGTRNRSLRSDWTDRVPEESPSQTYASIGDEFTDYMRERFGVRSDLWSGGVFWERSDSLFWGSRRQPATDRWSFTVRGWRVARINRGGFKPTTRLLRRFGSSVRRGCVACDRTTLRELLDSRETVPDVVPPDVTRGYVAVEGPGGLVLGCGFWTGDHLRSQFPKGLTRHFPDQAVASSASGSS